MRYVVLFPECQNIHLTKDVGMIPYKMNELYGWDAAIACYRNAQEYPYLDNEVRGLKLEFIDRRFNNSRLDGLLYLMRNAKSIDVLQIFHIQSTRNFYWIELYKRLNPNGKVYLKLDTDYGLVHYDFPFGKTILSKMRIQVAKKCSLISAETESTAYGLTNKWGIKVEWINNGFYSMHKTLVSYNEKENVICTVGRIGTYQKNNEVLLEAFERFSKENQDWKLKIIGTIEREFLEYINAFMKKNPQLKSRILFMGEITDREKLYEEYKKAKIFVLTSRWEGFAVSYMEALAAGCFIISSDVYCAYDVTDYQRLGLLFSIGDSIGLYKCINRVVDNESILEQVCIEAPKYAFENYNWDNNCRKIYQLLMNEQG